MPAGARELAARLAALFAGDCEIVVRLNDAQRRLAAANERLWSGLAPDAFGLIYDGAAPAGTSQIAGLIAARRAPRPRCSLRCRTPTGQSTARSASTSRPASSAASSPSRSASSSVQLTEALCAAGWSKHDAERADVHQLARASEPATRQRESQR